MEKKYHDILNGMATTQYGQALKVLLDEELKELGDVENATSWDDTLGRQHAVKIIKRLFVFMEPKKKVDKSQNQYS